MRFLQEKLIEKLPPELSGAAALFCGSEFDRGTLCTEAVAQLSPALERLAPVPAEGWLRAAYAFLTDGLFRDADYTPPEEPTRRAIVLLIDALEALLSAEDAPFDPLTDLLAFDQTLPTRLSEEYALFQTAVVQSHFLLTLRISREIMPFDAASHTFLRTTPHGIWNLRTFPSSHCC